MKKTKKSFYAVNWNFTRDKLEFYDVIPYLMSEFKAEKKSKFKIFCWGKEPKTFEDYRSFVNKASMYQYGSRCEYETIVTGWPKQKSEHKLDVYEQIKANLDIVTEILMSNLGIEKN